MTAVDTTNLRIAFTVPASGSVLVRLRCATKGASTSPVILLGVLEGATVRGRQAPITGKVGGAANALLPAEACFIVTGLTPGANLTWDAAYGVEFGVALTAINYGGPNNSTASDAAGAFVFEVWDTAQLLAAKMYDPAAEVSKATSAALAMTALDTTNLRVSFTVPSSGRVLVKMRGAVTGGTGSPILMFGILEGATVRGRACPIGGSSDAGSIIATDYLVYELVVVVSGLTPGANLTWDAAYGVETVTASSNLVYGGPNDSTASNAAGGLAFEVWAA